MYDGWFSFAGNEIVNSTRARAYMREALPHLVVEHSCGDGCGCEHLPAFLGEKPYATPLIDDAPWVDLNRQESFGFYGVQTLGVVGLTDDSRTADLLDAIDDGGWITGQRREPKQARFTVLLAAADDESMHYGENWLRTALDDDCGGGCTPTAQLCFLTACVDPSTFSGTTRETTHPLSEWRLNDSQWIGGSLRMRSEASWGKLSVRGSCGDVQWSIQMQGEAGSAFILEHDGFEDIHVFDGTLQTFFVSSTGAEITLRPIGGTAGMASWTEPTTTEEPLPTDEWAEHRDDDAIEGLSFQSSWTTYTTVPLDIQIVKVTSVAHFEQNDEECSREFYRYLRRVACIDGPRMRREHYPEQGGVLKTYEFTLAAEVPYLFGEPVVAAQGPSTGIVEQATPYRVVRLANNLPECVIASPGPLLDPLQSISRPPPSSYVPGSEFREQQLRAEERSPHAIIIPAETIPQWTSVVPIVSITAADEDVRFVRVRFVPMPIDSIAPSDLDPCSVCGSFEVAYIPAGHTFVIDGTAKAAFATIGDSQVNGNHLVTSVTGTGTPDWPVLSCGVGYVCIIDTRDQSLTEVKIELVVRE